MRSGWPDHFTGLPHSPLVGPPPQTLSIISRPGAISHQEHAPQRKDGRPRARRRSPQHIEEARLQVGRRQPLPVAEPGKWCLHTRARLLPPRPSSRVSALRAGIWSVGPHGPNDFAYGGPSYACCLYASRQQHCVGGLTSARSRQPIRRWGASRVSHATQDTLLQARPACWGAWAWPCAPG